ncbi:STAS domain-containing protein [Aldersonia sp. NBC_00410]|uniref:STAS domain-containing protein n=1 Tax=Aldersonia sp. NBC_00410 TaxID=2975954 RepID=UPI00225B959E|nr:STAS domain-containing protein [Aldersonia sp. NBC_00410]MCX5042326.1 STAS domain-containing protein [Aldersonia sp. NBC_00410]
MTDIHIPSPLRLPVHRGTGHAGSDSTIGRTPGNGSAGIRGATSRANELEVGVTWHDDLVVVGVSGILDMVSAPQLADSIQNSLENAPAVVIVDLTGVEFLASAGMTVLLTAHQHIGESAQFAVVADGPAVGRPLHLVGVDKLLTIHTTLAAALEASTVK